jgi:nicotinamidase/pyrazinamidase
MGKVFVDVDTIHDFFDGGALPVPGSNIIRPVLANLTKLAKIEKITVLKFNDSHDGSEPEMQTNGGPFPFHCIKDSVGAAGIIETANNRAVIFEKQSYDVFDSKLGNKLIGSWLMDNHVTEAWVYGVATDWCIKAAVLGLLKLGIKTFVFENAIMGMDPDSSVKAIKEMKKSGANFAKAIL